MVAKNKTVTIPAANKYGTSGLLPISRFLLPQGNRSSFLIRICKLSFLGKNGIKQAWFFSIYPKIRVPPLCQQYHFKKGPLNSSP